MDHIVKQAIPEMRKLQKEGKVHYVGISGYPLDVLLAVARTVKVDFVLTYAHYAIQNVKLANYVEEFQKLGVGIINASPFVLAFFTRQGPPTTHYAPPEMKQLSPVISKLCDEKGVDVSQLAIKFSIHSPLAKNGAVATTLVGIANPEQVESAVKCLAPLTTTEKELVQRAQEILGPKWMNYSWREGHSNQDKLLASVPYVPPNAKVAKL